MKEIERNTSLRRTGSVENDCASEMFVDVEEGVRMSVGKHLCLS